MRKLAVFAIWVFLFIVAIYFLVIGRSILIPLTIAIVIWYLITAITEMFEKTPYVGQYLPHSVALVASLAFCLWVLWFVTTIVTASITDLLNSAPEYQERLVRITDQVFDFLGMDKPKQFSSQFFEGFDVVSIVSTLARTITELAGSAGIILIYVLFLLLEHHSFDKKLAALIKEENKIDKARTIVNKIVKQIESYVRIKTVLSILTATASYTVLKGVGVDFAEFWCLMIFLFNYIPTIGSIIATVLPCLLTIIQFEAWGPFLFVTLTLSSIQVVIGNIIEPRVMGRSFNLSALVILLSLSLWGQMWGVTGMFLCVPFMVILNIILSNFPQTQPIAILMSQDGKIR